MIDRATNSDFLDEPDLEVNLALIDVMKGSKTQCKIGVIKFKEILDSGKLDRIALLIELIEQVSKNGSIFFHELISKQTFLDSLSKVLAKRRKKKKGGLLGKLQSKKSKE